VAQTIETYEKCPQCHGKGYFNLGGSVHGSPNIPCDWLDCNQTGYVVREKTTYNPGLDDVMDKLADVPDKLDDIIEKLNE